MKRAHHLGLKYVILYGDGEWESQKLTLKNMQTGAEELLDFDALAKKLKPRIMIENKLKQVKARHQEVTEKLNAGNLTPPEMAELGRNLSKLEPLMEKILLWEQCQQGIDDAIEMLSDKTLDAEMHAMAEEEKHALTKQLEQVTQEIRLALLPKGRGRRTQCYPRNSSRHRR